MKKFIIPALAFFLSLGAGAQDSPLWMRYCTISPDGETIAFTYKGDIYTVPVSGGKATQLTTNPAHDTRPVWSPDSKQIAFASNRNSNFDIYLVSKDGGIPKQLTTHTANEYPEAFTDNKHILYSTAIQPDVKDGQFPSSIFFQIYKVDTEGGRPELFSSIPMQHMALDNKGERILYTDVKGYEDPWRKHHQSSIARDIWMYKPGKEKYFEKITSFRGEDRNAVWAPDNNAFYYLSEQKGSFNIFKSDLKGGNIKQLTTHTTHPVRFLSIDNKGTLCYGYDGEIYTLKEGSTPRKVNIRIVSDKLENDLIHQLKSGGATDIAVAPSGKEVAFIVRGDVYVTSVDYTTTQRITNTPEQERNLDFSPDGRTLIYSSERNGMWGIYKTELVRKDDKSFTYAHELKEEPLVVSDKASFQPHFSPDGKEVAFLENRTTLRVIDLKSKKVRTVLDGKYNYSYSDGDQYYQWSPDSKWFLVKYISIGGWNNTDIALVKADGSGDITNLTESGYSDQAPKWVLDGKAMIWSTDRAGYRSHGSWGAERDVYIMFFDGEAYDKFRMNKEEYALAEEEEKEKEKKKDEEKSKSEDKKDKNKKEDDKKNNDKKKEEDKKEVKPLTFDLANRADRIIRLTINSSHLGDAVLTPKGDKLYYFAAFERGYDLWERNFKENTTKLLIKGVGGEMFMDKKGENIFLLSGGGLKKIETKGNTVKNIAFNAPFDYRPQREREYIFHHAWQQVKDKFYTQNLHGIDWKGYQKAYKRYLPHINNNFDFQEMLSELLGELNGSHTGARYYGTGSSYSTAALGAFYDEDYTGDGLKIKEIIKKGPLTLAKSKIQNGCIIEKIDGTPIKKGENYYPLLDGKAGKKVLLSVYNPSTKERFEEQIKPISYGEQSGLLYKRWVEQRRNMVDKLSGGKIGYVHVKGMDSQSFRDVYSELLGRYRNKEAVIIDTRHNGGGWLHDDLVTLLSGKEYQQFVPRGQYIGSDPYNKWLKPSAVLVCEDNYSNAHGFPFVYKTLGVGKLIGAPVPGTMTAVWWESQIDPTLVFGIPQVGVKDMQGNYLENQELQPDIEVYNDPASQLEGKDKQLEKAVEYLLEEVSKK